METRIMKKAIIGLMLGGILAMDVGGTWQRQQIRIPSG